MTPKFSIIIPIRKTNDFLKENITAIKNLDYSNFEAIIVLDEEEDFDFDGDSRFVLTVSGPVGPGEKRNIGAKQSRGEILVFLDDDAYPKHDWLTKAEEAFDTLDTYALGGPAVTPLNADIEEKICGFVLEEYLTSAGTVYRHKPSSPRKIDDYPSVNLFVKKDAFNSVGGFTTEFWPGEDTKLCLDLIKFFKKPFWYSPKPIVYHHRRRNLTAHLKQVSRYGRHRGQFAKIFPENSRVLGYFIPSLFVAGLLAGFITMFFSPLLKLIYLLVLSVYLLLILAESARISVREKSIYVGIKVGLGIILTHLVYGTNFIIGLIKKPKLKLKAVDMNTGNYAEG